MPHYNRLTLQCRHADDSPSHVFIAGDANQELPLLHVANTEGRIACHNAGRYPDVRAGIRNVPLAVVFTDPQMATIGASRGELEKRYGGCDGIATGQASFEDQGRAVVIRQNRGLTRLYANLQLGPAITERCMECGPGD